MNSPVHLVSQAINSFWLAVITTSLFLLLRELYAPDLDGWWFSLIFGGLLGLVAFVPHGSGRLRVRHVCADSRESERVLDARSLETLFKADVVGVAGGGMAVMLVKLLLQ